MKEKHIIVGVHVTDRVQRAGEVQRILTANGQYVKTRLGVHEVEGKLGAPNGLILLEFAGGEDRCLEMMQQLSAIEGLEVQRMVFDHPA